VRRVESGLGESLYGSGSSMDATLGINPIGKNQQIGNASFVHQQQFTTGMLHYISVI
jgi:hypothetical protein